MKNPFFIGGLEASLAIAIADEMISRWLGLPPSTWRHKVAIVVATAAALVIWHGYRFGWNRLLDPTLAGKSAVTTLLAWGLWTGADWLVFHLPYEPTVSRSRVPWGL